MRRFAVTAFSLFIFSAQAQTRATSWTFGSFDTKLTQISFRMPVNSPEDEAITSIAESLKNIEARYLAKYGANADTEAQIATNVSAEFSQSMSENLDILVHLPTDQAERLRILLGVRDDLKIKDQYTSVLMAVVAAYFPSIVNVHFTLSLPNDGSIKASSISVRYVSCGDYARDPGRGPGHVIGNGGGPFAKKMSPGCFYVWLEKDGKFLHSFREEVGKTGKSDVNIPLPIG